MHYHVEVVHQDPVRAREALHPARKRAPFVLEAYQKRLAQRINQLLNKAELQVNEADLVKEVAVFAERADIAEEIQRLTGHLDAFEQSYLSDLLRRHGATT